MADTFDLTSAGYVEAKQWLIDTKQLHLLEKELSKDGYSLVALANHLKEKECQIPQTLK